MTAEEILRQLNPEQRRAASTIAGPVLVLAGAGTGKTRVITYRIAYMLATGIAPEHILGMTFTNKAATEMKERLAALAGAEAAQKVTLGTFHAFACRLLRREIAVLGYLPNFTIADDSDQKSLIKQAAAACGFTRDDAPVPQAAVYISRCKNAMLTPEAARREAAGGGDEIYAQIYARYQELLMLQNMLDFDDLLLFAYQLLHDHPEIRGRYQEHYQYLLVDEYQDTNLVQFELIKLLAGERQNLCVVGDDDQSIYGWRGADAGNILKFTDHFPRAAQQEIKLEQNYRSTNNILKAANAAIAQGYARKEKNLWSDFGDGEPIIVAASANAEAEAEFIASYLHQFFDEHREYRYGDCAVLYRSNYLSRQLEQTLRMREIPYQLVGGQEFYQRSEVKDAAAYLRLTVNPREDQSLLRILGNPPRGLGEKAVAKLKEWRLTRKRPMLEGLGSAEFGEAVAGKGAAAARSLHATVMRYRELFAIPGELAAKVKAYLSEVGYLDGLQKVYKDIEDATRRRENVDEFINAIAQFEAKQPEAVTLADFLEKFALLEENDRTADNSEKGDGVVLSTIHAAKGLEFPLVFVVALEQNIFPNERALHEDSLDEELRLFYVALTRAKRYLVLTHAAERFRYGRVERQRPSEFLNRLPEELTDSGEDYEYIQKLSVDSINAGFAKIFELLK